MGEMGGSRQSPTVALSNEMSDFMRVSTTKCGFARPKVGKSGGL